MSQDQPTLAYSSWRRSLTVAGGPLNKLTQQALVLERAVRLELDRDILAGNVERGRAGRIAAALRGHLRFYHHGELRTGLSRAGVDRVLRRLFSGNSSSRLNGGSSGSGECE